MRILLLSAYDGLAHRYWCEQVRSIFSDADIAYMTLPARYFQWRVRGNPISWISELEQLAMKPDVIIATSMVDIATIKGLHPKLAEIPTICYFHENQFAYPESKSSHPSIEPQVVSIYNALAANIVVFNSQYNYQTFTNGCELLLKKFPDHVPAGLIERIKDKSTVLPVPINTTNNFHQTNRKKTNKLRLLWNHRWEHDKGPDRLYELLQALCRHNIEYSIAIIGESFRETPKALQLIRSEFEEYISHFGFIESLTDYKRCLSEADICLSTALHDFQGLAIMEAVNAGCVPLLPKRLAYEEFYDASYLYDVSTDIKIEANNAVYRVKHWVNNGLPARPCLSHLSLESLSDKYRALVNRVID